MAQPFSIYLYANGGVLYASNSSYTMLECDIGVLPSSEFYANGLTINLVYENHTLVGWNSQADGNGTSYAIGDTATNKSTYYAIWEEATSSVTYYITSSDELTSIADAIRSKAGTSNLLEFPTGFVDAITNIS